ncbi:type I polyketide synthase [Streptomyces sp. NBC_01775]|uniref:type I polyketide synthase n=1 Tax=Streptomyces sp. NBC_01775 TaxID=2975939 RepID=UPI002DDC1C5D|nr:type I polyketide synthase [Streptomyces sp. NBC_01775]WSB74842.1 type I polyketide synthase [Streptomyces sp. NBC_01775]
MNSHWSTAAELRERLAGESGERRTRILLDLVRERMISALGGTPGPGIADNRPFREIGIKQEARETLRHQLTRATGVDLSPTVFFDYPTPLAVARHLGERLSDRPAADSSAPARPPAWSGEPIAIVGMACRYGGGVASPEDLWELVESGRDAVTGFPADRGWDLENLYDPDSGRRGRSYTRAGAFLDDIAGFDAGFFGVSAREAAVMDPQQRLLLETAWEALERCGTDPRSLEGTATGTFIGTNYQDYRYAFDEIPEAGEGYVITGNAASVMSGRLAYTLGLRGPAVTLDTACSSSLVALHQACQALRSHECDLALVGGASVLSTPEAFVEFSRKRVLSVDGRCKAFAESADGTGWGEGVGVVLVERLSDALREGRRVLAVVRGSAVNQNGASNGLTAPNGPAQVRVIRAALAGAGVSAVEVDAVEAHGTGTRLGDPIEAGALLETYGRGRSADRPVWLGSVKSNIAHTQAASGVAGVIKMVEAMRHGVLPRTLHAEEPSSHVDWSSGGVRLLTEARPWPAGKHPRRAAVSSFGVSGTNAHVILEEAPAPAPVPAAPEPEQPGEERVTPAVVPWVLSGRTEPALREQAARLLARVGEDPDLDVAELGAALVRNRSVFEHRAVVVGEDRAGLVSGLEALAAGVPAAHVLRGAAGHTAAPVFVFPGQGSHWVGMGRDLLRSEPAFAQGMEECAAALRPWVDWDLFEVLADAEALERVDVVQPVLWSVMVALARTWRAFGVEPGAVLGHSQGEVAAACVAGALSLDDGARVVVARSRSLLKVAGTGGIVSVMAPPDRVREMIVPWGDRLAIAAVNGPSSVSVSGEDAALTELERQLSAHRVVRWRVPGVEFMAHSRHIEDLSAELEEALAPVRPATARIPFFSTVDTAWQDGPELEGHYWYRNLRETVRFGPAVVALAEQGYRGFLEVGAHPALTDALEQNADAVDGELLVAATLQRDNGGLDQLYRSLAAVFVAGTPVDWEPAFVGVPSSRAELPTYPFQRQRFWPEKVRRSPDAAAHGSPAEQRFWQAVEGGDPAELSALLEVAEQREAASLREALPALTAWRLRDRASAALDRLRYRVTWSPAEFTGRRLSGSWLAVIPDSRAADEWGRELLDGLSDSGAVVLPLVTTVGERREELLGRLRSALDSAGLRASDISGVVSLLALDEEPDPEHPGIPAGVTGTLACGQALGDAGVRAPLWLLTRGAVSVGGKDPLDHPSQALTWGLGRVVGLEHLERWGGLVDLPPALDAGVFRHLSGVLGAATDEDHLAIRDNGVHVRRLVRAPRDASHRPHTWRPRPDGTVLITGGTGVQAGHVARRLARDGAPHLLLLGRRGDAAPGMPERVRELEALGARVTVAACDVRDREALRRVLAAVPEDLPLSAVFHTAGVGRLQELEDTSPADLADIVEAKAVGARHLHELTEDLGLDAFVLFSAVTATWGVGRHGSYGAANTYLEALAQHRRTHGLPATAIAWGGWAGDGMAVRDAAQETLRRRGLPADAWAEAGLTRQEAADETLHRWGVHVLEPEQLLAALQYSLDADETLVTVADMDWERFVTGFALARRRPLLRELPEAWEAVETLHGAAGEQDVSSGQQPSSLADRLAGSSRQEQDRLLLDMVRTQVATVLGHSEPEALDPRQTFLDAGLDSVTAVQLRNQLGSAVGLRLPATVVFDHPTATELVAFLRTRLVPEEPVADETLLRIDELEQALTAASHGPEERRAIEARLTGLVRKWGGARRSEADDRTADDLEAAGVNELLDLLDGELGTP